MAASGEAGNQQSPELRSWVEQRALQGRDVLQVLTNRGLSEDKLPSLAELCLESGMNGKLTHSRMGVELAGFRDKPVFDEEELELIKFLISKGADVNARDSEGNTPLMNALTEADRKGRQAAEMVGLLVEAGADVNAASREGMTALHKLAEVPGSALLARALVQQGADLEAPMTGASPVMGAAKFKGVTPFLLACMKGELGLANTLLDLGAKPDVVDADGETALHSVCYTCSAATLPLVQRLLDLGLDVNATTSATRLAAHAEWEGFPMTPLGCVIAHRNSFYYRANLQNSDRDIPDGEEWELPHLLLDKGADPTATWDQGRDLLWWVLKGADGDTNPDRPARGKLIAKMVEKGADPAMALMGTANWTDDGDDDAEASTGEEAKQLLAQCLTSVDVTNKHGDTALLLAARRQLYSACAFLLSNGASVEATDAQGNTPLHAAVGERVVAYPRKYENRYKDGLEAEARAKDVPKIVQALLEKGATVDAKNAQGTTPLINAAVNEMQTACELLLEAGADPKATDESKQSAGPYLKKIRQSEGGCTIC